VEAERAFSAAGLFATDLSHVPTVYYKPSPIISATDFGDYSLSHVVWTRLYVPAWVTTQLMLYANSYKSVRTTGTLVLNKVFIMRECASLRYFTLLAKMHRPVMLW